MKKIYVDEIGISSVDIKNENSVEILNGWKIELNFILAEMSTQLVEAKGNAQANDKYSNVSWFKAISHKKKLYGICSQLIQMKLGVLKRESNKELSDVFIDVAREELDEDDFTYILGITKLRCER